jgi:hypothetical protein
VPLLVPPNAGGEPRPIAFAPTSLRLSGVGSTALLGSVFTPGAKPMLKCASFTLPAFSRSNHQVTLADWKHMEQILAMFSYKSQFHCHEDSFLIGFSS